MIYYLCDTCGINAESSVCPVCGNRTTMKSEIYWCKTCNCPSYYKICNKCHSEGKMIGKDIRPVFPEERLLIEILMNNPLKYIDSSVWANTSGGSYIIDGEKVNIRIKDLDKLNDSIIREQYSIFSKQNNYSSFEKIINTFVEVNQLHFNSINSEALQYIQNQIDDFTSSEMFVSFSGGKDSTVVSDLVMRATGNPHIMHIFGDTTLEFPETLDYVKRFKKEHKFTPMISAKNKEKKFGELCELIGPPSRVMRWCCTVFKTGAITKKIDTLYKSKSSILSFQGIRRVESASRNKYDRESSSPKITKQTVISPIIDWLDFDVWLYLLTRNIDFNTAYRLGYTRVGCWCCPNNSGWSAFLSKIHMSEQFYNFRTLLIDFAKSIGKADAEVYVDSGMWKARQGGNGISYSANSFVSFQPCALEENSFNYVLKKTISNQLYEFFKPFGRLNYDLGNKKLGEVYILNSNNKPILKISGRPGGVNLKITIMDYRFMKNKNIKDAEIKIKNQLTKFQMCLNCTACPSICKYDAITITGDNNNLNYKVNEKKCVHCGECINHFNNGCYMKKVLATKKGD